MSLRTEQNWKWSNKTFPHTLCVVGTSDETTHCGIFYLGGAQNKGFATLRNVSKLTFFDKSGQAKSVVFQFYSAI